MFDKLLPCLICGAVGALVGEGLKNICKSKKEFFEDFEKFLQKYLTNLSYEKNTVIEFSKKYSTKSKLLDRQLKTLCENNFENQMPCGVLSKIEYSFVNDTFESLGKKDSISERAVIQNRLDEVKSYKVSAENTYNKVGKSYVKLGLLLGLMLGVLLI